MTFYCARWPQCGCPDGTHRLDCPGVAAMGITRDGIVRALSPSLEDQLAAAQRDLMCARMIDDWTRCQRETAAAQARISEIKRQMEARDAD